MPGGRRGGGGGDVPHVENPEKSTRMRHKTRKFLLAPVPGATLGRKLVFSGAPQAKFFGLWSKNQPKSIDFDESVCLRLRGGGSGAGRPAASQRRDPSDSRGGPGSSGGWREGERRGGALGSSARWG